MNAILKSKWAGIAIAAFFFGCILGYLFQVYTSDKYAFLSNGERISSCLSESILQDKNSIDEIDNNLSFCYRKIWYQTALDDYNVRRHIFQNQYTADIVLLWMVVLITLSGVFLAALQLYTSYDLAKHSPSESGGQSEPASSLEIEKGKIALKSSVTGLFILLISFGFFYIYVILVYRITEPVGSNTSAGQELSSHVSPLLSEDNIGIALGESITAPLQSVEDQSKNGGGFGSPPAIGPNQSDNGIEAAN